MTLKQTRLIDAVSIGDVSLVRLLLLEQEPVNATDEDGCTALQLAIGDGFVEIAVLLLEAGADPLIVDHSGFTLLHWATLSNDIVAMELSFADEVGIDPRDARGRTPLSWACSDDHVSAVKWLLGRGAKGDISDYDGWTPLHYSAGSGRLQSAELMISAGADTHALSAHHETPFDVAKRLGMFEVAVLLGRLTNT